MITSLLPYLFIPFWTHPSAWLSRLLGWKWEQYVWYTWSLWLRALLKEHWRCQSYSLEDHRPLWDCESPFQLIRGWVHRPNLSSSFSTKMFSGPQEAFEFCRCRRWSYRMRVRCWAAWYLCCELIRIHLELIACRLQIYWKRILPEFSLICSMMSLFTWSRAKITYSIRSTKRSHFVRFPLS